MVRNKKAQLICPVKIPSGKKKRKKKELLSQYTSLFVFFFFRRETAVLKASSLKVSQGKKKEIENWKSSERLKFIMGKIIKTENYFHERFQPMG